ncbi:hypothetical protein BDV3_001339 [Batrachochytrium dendrobatidis]|nr:hypothetical protein O5D80_002346 [Batrachochytrium dendrobatidis]KAK5668525.1 hypothetical protein QVD99_005540 [Batrachochytrium dendrobatidis]
MSEQALNTPSSLQVFGIISGVTLALVITCIVGIIIRDRRRQTQANSLTISSLQPSSQVMIEQLPEYSQPPGYSV